MSLTRNDYTVEYDITGDGLMVFPFSFPVRDKADVRCYDVDAAGADTAIPATRFEVTASTDGLAGGGSVRLAAALATGHILRIERRTPITQAKSFTNQKTIPPPQVEDGLDILTMIAQEHDGRLDGIDGDVSTIHGDLDDLNAALAAEAQARQQADATLQANITAEAQARAAVDTRLQANIDTEARARQDADAALGSRIEAARSEAAAAVAAEAQLRQQADAALQTAVNAKAAASDVAAFRESVNSQLASLRTEVDGKMPKAPDDGGTYLGTGGQWIAQSQKAGDPFIPDPSGYAVLVNRAAYIPNDVWNIGTEYLTLSEAAGTGDGDSLFVVDSDGYLALR